MIMCSQGRIYFLFPLPTTKFEKESFLDFIFLATFFSLYPEKVKISWRISPCVPQLDTPQDLVLHISSQRSSSKISRVQQKLTGQQADLVVPEYHPALLVLNNLRNFSYSFIFLSACWYFLKDFFIFLFILLDSLGGVFLRISNLLYSWKYKYW